MNSGQHWKLNMRPIVHIHNWDTVSYNDAHTNIVMNNTYIYITVEGPSIYMYRRGRIYEEPTKEIQQ
jgi:hypothetical protein